MQVAFLLEDADVLLVAADDIEAVVTNGTDTQTFSLLTGTVKKWINGTFIIDVNTASWKQGEITLSYRTKKNDIFSEWYKQVISYKR